MPVHVNPALTNVGVTVIVATAGLLPLLIPLKAGILPVPLEADKPIVALLFVQGKVVPVTDPVKEIVPLDCPLHIVMFAGRVTVGLGFTVTVNVFVGPVQNMVPESKYRGVTVMVAVTGDVEVFVAMNELISPVPLAARPIPGVLLAHV